MKTRFLLVSLVLAVGCKKEAKQAPPAPEPATKVTAAAGSATTTPPPAPTPDAAPAPATFFPAKLAESEGIVFAETKGGTVEVEAVEGGTKANIPDGTLLKIEKMGELSLGDGEHVTHEVTWDGKRYRVPGPRMLTEGDLRRSPDGTFAVFVGPHSCGDVCHTELAVIGVDGARKAIGGGLAQQAVAWRKDNAQLAVGSGTLWLVTLPSLEVKEVEGYQAPSYAPDGTTLYARDFDGSAFVFEGDTPKQLWKAKKRKTNPNEGDYGAMQNPPLTFDAAGKPQLELPKD